MLELVRQHPRAMLYAAIVHIVLIGILVFSFHWSDKPTIESKDKGKEIIKAVTVDASKINKELRKIKAAERKKQRDLERAAKKATQARIKEEQRLADAKKKTLAQQRELEDKRMQEQARIQELEEKRKQEEERLEKIEQQKREEELRQKLAEEQQRLALEGDKQRQSTINQYRALIEAKVRRHWNIPASAQEGMSCVLKVRIIPSGDVTSVLITKSSGDAVFDRSVENAIRKASPLPVPSADTGLFDMFRDLEFPFKLEKKS